ncbi:MAG: pyrroline-5-carboxylate reductase [Planctomycetes bacterium]|nr:pyrroline-5-carboxylate reductase [Planctomycetota bacterium]
MLDLKLVLIGGGNMGEALLRSVLSAGVFGNAKAGASRVSVVDVSTKLLDAIHRDHKVNVTTDAKSVVPDADVLLLAVKPFVLADVLDDLRDIVRGDQLILSIVAGVEGEFVRDRLGKNNPVVRAMPNIAATVGESASALAKVAPATDEHLSIAEEILGAAGNVVRVEENHLDAVTGLSGSGPAYVYTVIEALSDGGVRMGLTREVARQLATQTVLGAARLVHESGEHPAVLRDRVTTPGGTTIAGLQALEESGLRAALMGAVEAATRRSRELGETK